MSKRVDKEDLEKFYEEAKESEVDLFTAQNQTISFLKKLVWALVIIAALEGVGLVRLIPLKQWLPFLLSQDSTGHVQALNMLEPDTITQHQAVVDYFISIYIKNRESYSAKNIQTYYDNTIAMSSDEEGRAWDKKYFDGKNAMDKVLGDSVVIEVNVRNVIPDYDNKKAVVRFEKKYIYPNKAPVTEYWSADVSWFYETSVMKVSQTAANPLGIKVDDYRSSQELTK
ncbi:type IV secretion system protein [Acinetobacter variabilis]|uniref:type IV secretion system protein n=1 Tax=Acinetobacter variabilis TaxID=70346 RepID=UPI0028A6480E|nr:type IV secretion system protein [Acinetobacter variabilis]